MFPEAEGWSLTSSGAPTNQAPAAFACTLVIMATAAVTGHFVDIQKVPTLDRCGHFADNRLESESKIVTTSVKVLDFLEFFGATRRIRTDDLLITNRIC
jgi:hypothetical protein